MKGRTEIVYWLVSFLSPGGIKKGCGGVQVSTSEKGGWSEGVNKGGE